MNDKAKELIYIALGNASVAWKELLNGEFDSSKAKEIGDELIIKLEELEKQE